MPSRNRDFSVELPGLARLVRRGPGTRVLVPQTIIGGALRFADSPEELDMQDLLSEAAVAALDERVLARFAWLG